MIKSAIAKIVEKEDLTKEEATQVMNEIMEGEATEAQIASFITALRMKGETVEEITSCAQVMREHATFIRSEGTIVDTCGTGGDPLNTFNISTTSAFVVAGAGLKVAKHGNRAVSSQSGSADVISALGVNLEASPEKVEECLNKIGIGFLYAPLLHKAMKYAIGPRRQVGIRTIFNILGPLTNPARANAQVLGVYSPSLTSPLAQVLANLGVKHAFVVYGMDGLDELSITGETKVSEMVNKKVKDYIVTPEELGLKRASIEDISGGTAKEGAQIILDLLKGKGGPRRDVVLLNASAAIVAGGKANNLPEGIKLAEESIDSGKALEKLELLKEYTNR